jgi:hypothetical protein
VRGVVARMQYCGEIAVLICTIKQGTITLSGLREHK